MLQTFPGKLRGNITLPFLVPVQTLFLTLMFPFCFIKGHTSSPTSVATVSISTSAVTTTTNRDLHITPENPFGVIGDVATATTAYQSNFSLSV